MTKPTKYVVRHEGVIIGKRASHRVYTHAVIAQHDEEFARKAAYDYVATDLDRSNFDYSAKIVAQGVNHDHVTGWRKEPDLSVLEKAKARIEGGFDAFVARERADMIERFEGHKARNGFRPYVAAFAGRRDLAEKSVSQHADGRRVKFVAIVPVEIVSK